MPLLSSLVFLGVICSRYCEQHHCRHRDFSTSKTTALPPPPLLLLRSDHRLHHRKEISPICLSVKYRLHRTFHAPPCATEVSASLARAFTCRQYSPCAVTRLQLLPRACMRQGSSADVSPRWRHLPRHRHVIYWRHLPRHPLTSSAMASANVICHGTYWRHRWPDRWLWPLTFPQGWLFQSKFFLPSFSRRFHFCSLFLHIVSLNR